MEGTTRRFLLAASNSSNQWRRYFVVSFCPYLHESILTPSNAQFEHLGQNSRMPDSAILSDLGLSDVLNP